VLLTGSSRVVPYCTVVLRVPAGSTSLGHMNRRQQSCALRTLSRPHIRQIEQFSSTTTRLVVLIIRFADRRVETKSISNHQRIIQLYIAQLDRVRSEETRETKEERAANS